MANTDQNSAGGRGPSTQYSGAVGTILRGARLARDEELSDVAAALRIRLPYLEAIEDGRQQDLPGLTYGIGFVRAYAIYVELDPDALIQRFKDESRGLGRQTQLQFPEPLPGNRVPSAALLFVAFLFAAAGYGAWLYTNSQDLTFVEAVEAVPENLMSLLDSEEEASSEQVATEDAAESVPDAAASDAMSDVAETASVAATEVEQVAEATASEATAVAEEAVEQVSEAAVAVEEEVEETASAVEEQVEEVAASSSDVVSGEISEASESTVTTEDTAVQAVEETVAEAVEAEPEEVTQQVNEAVEATEEAAVDSGSEAVSELQEAAQEETQDAGATEQAVAAVESSEPDQTTEETATAVETVEEATTTIAETVEGAVENQAEAEPVATEDSAVSTEIEESKLAPPVEEETIAQNEAASDVIESAELEAPPVPEEEDDAAAAEGNRIGDALGPVDEGAVEATSADAEPEQTASAESSTAQAPRIIIQATNESWVKITAPDGDVLMERLMLMGEIYRVPYEDGLVMDTGNAGALKLIVNGTLVPALGESGAVIQGISLAPDDLLP